MTGESKWRLSESKWLAAVFLFLLAPVCAEYLYGYLEASGDPLKLLGALIVLAPLYGGPALLIREIVRRRRLGWLSMLLLAGAFGVFQAGIVDHSLFNANYRDLESLREASSPTRIPFLGVSLYTLLTFVGNHVIYSIGVPIALTEGIFSSRRDTPWLNWPVLLLTIGLYAMASYLIFRDHITTQNYIPSPSQLLLAVKVVLVLVVVALSLRPKSDLSTLPVASPWVLSLVTFVSLGITEWIGLLLAFAGHFTFVFSPLGVAVYFTACLSLSAWIMSQSRRQKFTQLHATAIAMGATLLVVIMAFGNTPISNTETGEVPMTQKLLHNVACLAGMGIIGAMAAWRSDRGPNPRKAMLETDPSAHVEPCQ